MHRSLVQICALRTNLHRGGPRRNANVAVRGLGHKLLADDGVTRAAVDDAVRAEKIDNLL